MRRLIATALASGALVAATLAAAPASAQPSFERQRGGPHFPASVNTKIPPGSYAAVGSPAIPKDTATLQVELVAKANATQAQVDVFDQMTQVLGKMTKAKRLLTCILLYNAFVTQAQAEDDYDTPVTFQANEAAEALVVLVGCVRLAGLVTSPRPVSSTPARVTPGRTSARALAGMTKCAQDKPGAPGTLAASDGSWTLTVDGDLKQTRSKLKVACRTKSGKTVLKIRAAKKGVPLRKVAGKRPVLAVFNSPDAEETVPVKVTFSLP